MLMVIVIVVDDPVVRSVVQSVVVQMKIVEMFVLKTNVFVEHVTPSVVFLMKT